MKIKRCGVYSFPKSGNTWMREILRGLFSSPEEIEKFVPDIYRDGVNGIVASTKNDEQWRFYKSHSAAELTQYKGDSITHDLIIYLMRNPLDVFCSQLNYLLKGCGDSLCGMQVTCNSVDEAKETGLINDYFSAFIVYGTLMPFFKDARSWMENTSAWLEKSRESDKIVVVKYEDMINQPNATLEPIVGRLGINPSKLSRAIELSNTRTNDDGKFFWKKKVGTYKTYLTDEQINRFLDFHHDAVNVCGYLNLFTETQAQ